MYFSHTEILTQMLLTQSTHNLTHNIIKTEMNTQKRRFSQKSELFFIMQNILSVNSFKLSSYGRIFRLHI